jgi:hypothetical protein
MEPNQNPPCEREWTIAEREEFFASQDAISGDITPQELDALSEKLAAEFVKDEQGLFSGLVADNGAILNSEPITLKNLQEIEDNFRKAFPVPVEFKDGADMSRATFDELGKSIKLVKPQGRAWLGISSDNFIGVQIHIVNSIPFGVVEECRCKERAKETHE